jgi:hypothetical protein
VSHDPTSHPTPSTFLSSKGVAFHRTLTYINHHPESGYRFARYLMLLIIAYLNPNQPLDCCTNEAIFYHLFSLLDYNEKTHCFLKSRKRQKQMKSKLFPSEVNILRKRVNLSCERSQLYSGERVNPFSMGKSCKRGGIWCVYHPK